MTTNDLLTASRTRRAAADTNRARRLARARRTEADRSTATLLSIPADDFYAAVAAKMGK
ncbi:MAG: hypothetical protein AB7L09_22030 [Nitrospira sp.]